MFCFCFKEREKVSRRWVDGEVKGGEEIVFFAQEDGKRAMHLHSNNDNVQAMREFVCM